MQPGDLIADRFVLERRIGQGGMGTVFCARDRRGAGVVALKLFAAHSDELRDRFEREAQLLAELSHPGLPGYVAHGVSGTMPWLAMEWLDGEDLSVRLGHGGLGIGETLRLARQVADVLAVAHAHGVVHRDIKPSNLLLVGGDIDRVKVLDFGIARTAGSGSLTRTGSVLGTPGYMPPEQVRGQRDVDARADVFALGCVLFECLTGQPPFVGSDVLAVLAKLALEDAPSVGLLRHDVPPALETLLQRMLARDRELRPSGGEALVAELSDLLRVTGADGRPSVGSLPALTVSEERHRSVLLARLPAPGGGDPDVALASTLHADEEARAAALRRLVEDHGGRVEALAGGAVVVTLLGAGGADLAVAAARCALALRRLVPQMPLALATGRSGRARTTGGDVIDRAARLLRLAEQAGDGSIRVDEGTAGLLDARFELSGDERGLVLARERDLPDTERRLLGKPAACVGRDRELLTLDAVFAECASESVARAVLITAAPGAGKSRLRHEFLRRLRQRNEPHELLVGRGDPLTAGSPLGFLVGAVRRAAGILDGEPPGLQVQKLRARVGRYLPEDGRERVCAFVGELADVRFPEQGDALLRAARASQRMMAEQTRRAWIDWLAAECGAAPVVLVLEDLHWADSAAVEFVDAALRELGDRPFMVLALARPEVELQFTGLWKERSVMRLALGELSRRASEKLVRDVMGERATPELVARIVERAGGNAFYLEELIRAVAEGSADDLPSSVITMVQVRLEGLAPDARRVLRAASIFGNACWRHGVVELLGGERHALRVGEWLDHLERGEFLVRRPTGRFPATDEYVFRHVLVREAAYETLVEEDRRLGHTLAAGWLARSGETDPVCLAGHWERGGDAAQAAREYLRAGERALSDGAPEAARAHLDRAHALGIDDAGVLAFATAFMTVNRMLARPRDTVTRIDEMLAQPHDALTRVRLLRLRITALRNIDIEQVLRIADDALAAAEAIGEELEWAAILSHASFAAYRRGDVARAAAYARQTEGRSFASTEAQIFALRARLFAATAAGDHEQALQLSARACELYLSVSQLDSAANESANIAESLLFIGDLEHAEHEAARARELGRQSGFALLVGYAEGLSGIIRAERGDVEGGLAVLARVWEGAMVDAPSFGDIAAPLVEFLLERNRAGDLAEACLVARAALARVESAGTVQNLQHLRAGYARALLRAGERDAALAQLAAAQAATVTSDNDGEYHAALAAAEILAPEDGARAEIIRAARASLLAAAALRRDPRMFLHGSLLRRRLIAVSGGLPVDG